MSSAVIFQIQSFLILCLMAVGIYFALKRKRAAHIKTQGIVIAWDILLILQIELSREAILKASKAMTNTMMLNIHVSIAVTTVLLYVAMIITGRKFLRGQTKVLPLHRKLGWGTLVMRILTFVTSFWSVSPQ